MSLEIIKPDGVSQSGEITYSTSLDSIFIRGRSSNLSALVVSYNQVEYTVDLEQDGSFIFPNPQDDPEGFDLVRGVNTFAFKGTKTSGGFDTSNVNVVLSSTSILSRPNAPLNLKVNRLANEIEITFEHSDSEISYYNLYASTESGGGVEGYDKVNFFPLDPSSYGRSFEEETDLYRFELNSETENIDPLMSRVSLIQSSVDGQTTSSTLSDEVEISETVDNLRVAGLVKSVALRTEIRFLHNRTNTQTSKPPTINVARFTVLDSSTPLYYVATSVKVVNDLEIESAYSSEVSGKPIDVLSNISSLPVVNRRVLTEQMISDIYLAQPDISVQAGSVFRDVVIDPFVSEMERTRFVLDFTYRSTSFASLLQIDDPLNSGASIQVSQSSYKRALGESLFLTEEVEIQRVIDQSFDRLASNFNITRKTGTFARGEVVFFTTSLPTFTLTVLSGTVLSGGGQSFRTTETVSIPLESVSSYYNPTTKRYSITCPIIALTEGSGSNLTTGQITSGAPLGLRVTNDSPTFGGEDEENNIDLTARALGSLSSVDTGTKAGYERVSRDSAGVIDSFVVGADDEFMYRDGGLGGKVDVWIRGESSATLSDVFAPTYKTKFKSRFFPIDQEGSYRFKIGIVGAEIFEMVNRSDLNLGLLNNTTGEYFDLTGYSLDVTKTVLILDSSINQPSYSLTDIILGDWREGVSEEITLTRQPVSSIVSVQKADTTAITNFTFNSNTDPLMNGRSIYSNDNITIPSLGNGTIISVTDESHVLIGSYKDQLNSLGADLLSIVVKSSDGLTTYKNPFQNNDPDYLIEEGSNREVFITRTDSSAIGDGDTVLISYTHFENIVVNYTSNLVVSSVQSDIDKTKHLSANVLVKSTIPAPVNVKGVVVLNRGVSPVDIDSLIKINLRNLINSSSLGGQIYSSDVIREIDSVEGVSYVNVPLTQLSFQQGTLILREKVSLSAIGGYRLISELSDNSYQVWLSEEKLKNVSQDGGGEGARVFIDRVEATLLGVNNRSTKSNWLDKHATITGNEGLRVLSGGVLVLISDTDNRVVISLPVGEHPSDYDVEVDYRTGDPTNVVKDLTLNRLSFFEVGDLSFTYEEVQ